MTTQQRFFKRPHLRRLISGLTLAVATLFIPAGFDTAHAAPTCTTSGNQVTCTFNFTGASETWTVPADVTAATFDLYGAQGGNDGIFVSGGQGGTAKATIVVTPGQIFQINVGGQGGFGGGGNGGNGGGGTSDVRSGSFSLNERIIVAGGGGGAGAASAGAAGGGGGGENGSNGATTVVGAGGGAGGSQTAGGAGGAGAFDGGSGASGGAGFGGAGGVGAGDGGGGGGGYYGGGSGGSVNIGNGGGGGGGGSGYGPTGVVFQTGVHPGNGQVIISYDLPDSTGPVITPQVTGIAGANGWYVSDVSVSWSVVDNESTVTSQSGCATQSVTSDTSGVTFTCAATSAGGNSSQSVTINRDATAPVVAITGVSNNASYTLGSVPTAGCSTTDALAGVATQATLSVSGGNPDGTGSFTVTCSGATDKAGNSGSASATYSIGYNWTGFFQPVDNFPTVNTVNAGQAIPVKFSLGGNFGLNIFASGYPASQNVSCSSGGGSGSTSPIDQTATTSNSSLQYDATTQTYTYVWKTDKAWAGTCRTLIVKLIDGTEHTAFFQFNGKARSAASDADGDAAVARQQIFLPLVNR